LMLVLATTDAQVSMPLLTFGGAIGAGIAFRLLDPWLIGQIGSRLPEFLSATVVAGLIATLVAAGIWFVTAVAGGLLTAGSAMAIDRMLGNILPGIIGGLLGGCVVGIAPGPDLEQD